MPQTYPPPAPRPGMIARLRRWIAEQQAASADLVDATLRRADDRRH